MTDGGGRDGRWWWQYAKKAKKQRVKMIHEGGSISRISQYHFNLYNLELSADEAGIQESWFLLLNV
jgi:hypothetical protein